MKRNEVRVALICVWWGGLVQKLNCWRRGLRQMVWIACCSWRVLMKKRTGFLRKDDRCGDGGWDEMKWDMLTINSKEDDGSENDGWGWFGLVRWWRSMIIKSVYMVFFFFFFLTEIVRYDPWNWSRHAKLNGDQDWWKRFKSMSKSKLCPPPSFCWSRLRGSEFHSAENRTWNLLILTPYTSTIRNI